MACRASIGYALYMNLIIASAGGRQSALRIKRPSERRSLSRSATRALDVLELFGQERRPIRAVEVSMALGFHPSTTNQLLKTMVDSGHLVFDARSKTYLPSTRLVDFGEWIVSHYEPGGRLRDLIRDLGERSGITVTLSTPNDLFMQVIDLVLPLGNSEVRGLQISLFGSAIGSAYLSTLDTEEVARLAYRARIPDEHLPTILAAARKIRLDGYAEGVSADGGTHSIAIALPMASLTAPTVLGLAAEPSEIQANLDRYVALMRDAIARWCQPMPG